MRTCGSCYVCCHETQIDEIDKPSNILCDHYLGKCSIYEARPKQCSSYRCSWLEGHGLFEDRPDITGLIVDVKNIEGNDYICAREIREDADRSILKGMPHDMPVLLKYYQSDNETGDIVIINDVIKTRAKSLMGEKIADNTYKLRIG